MGWMLVVSEDETFQREAILRVRGRQPVVGATGDSSARGLVRAVDVQTILVDALDDVGRRFLTVLRNVPQRALHDVEVVVVGPDSGPGFHAERSIARAISAA